MDFEHGLELLKEIAKQEGWYQKVLPHEAALRGYLQDERLYGPAPQTHQDLLRVVGQLNRLCLEHLEASFNDLCLDVVPSPSSVSLEGRIGAAVCFYALQDASFYRKLKDFLSLWERQGKIDWLEIGVGCDIIRTRQEHLQQASLIFLLCSSDFFAEPACYTIMTSALQEHARRRVPVLPVLVRACAWEESACSHLHILPENRQPVSEWVYPDQAYESIRRSLIRLAALS